MTGAARATAAQESLAQSRGWLLVAVVATYPLLQFVRRVIDTSLTVVDESGTTHFISDGRATTVAQLVIGGLLLGLGTHVAVRAHHSGELRFSSWAMTALILTFADLLRPERDVVALIYSGLAFVVLLCIGFGTIGPRDLSRVGYLSGGVAASLVLFAVIDPEMGMADCRPDKCSFAGGLLRGYFPQENVAGLFLVALLPAVAYVTSRQWRALILTVVLVAVVMSASRTAMASAVLALWAFVVIRRRVDPERTHGDSAKIVSLLPLLSLIISLAAVFTVSGLSLTGRGYIFELVRNGWAQEPLLGPGRHVVTDAYSQSQTWWYIAHEHGQGGYLLAQGGLVGVAAFVTCLVVIIIACWRSRSPVPALFALVPAVGFQTEPIWEFSLSSPFFASLLVTASLTAHAARGGAPPHPEPSRPEGHAPRESHMSDPFRT